MGRSKLHRQILLYLSKVASRAVRPFLFVYTIVIKKTACYGSLLNYNGEKQIFRHKYVRLKHNVIAISETAVSHFILTVKNAGGTYSRLNGVNGCAGIAVLQECCNLAV